MRYLYRCDCGWDVEKDYPMSQSVPEVLEGYGEHPMLYPDGSYSRSLCYGELRRVYEPSLVNMGYREGFHNSTEHWRFKHLSKD